MIHTTTARKKLNGQDYIIEILSTADKCQASLYWGNKVDSMPVMTQVYQTGNVNKASHAIWIAYTNRIKQVISERAFKKQN